MRCGKGAQQGYKLPITPTDLRQIHAQLNLKQPADCLLWAGILTCFFGLLRVSNVSVHPVNSPTTHYWFQLAVASSGVVLNIRASKTIQHQELGFTVTLPYIPGNLLCPTAALLHLLRHAPTSLASSPVFCVPSQNGRYTSRHPSSVAASRLSS